MVTTIERVARKKEAVDQLRDRQNLLTRWTFGLLGITSATTFMWGFPFSAAHRTLLGVIGTGTAIAAVGTSHKLTRVSKDSVFVEIDAEKMQEAQSLTDRTALGIDLKGNLARKVAQYQPAPSVYRLPEWYDETCQAIERVFRKSGIVAEVIGVEATPDAIHYVLHRSNPNTPLGEFIKRGNEVEFQRELMLEAGLANAKVGIWLRKLFLAVPKQTEEVVQAAFDRVTRVYAPAMVGADAADKRSISFTVAPQSAPNVQPEQGSTPSFEQPAAHDRLSVYLGNGREDNMPRSWDLSQQPNGFFLGLGASGSGKTETLKVIATEIRNYGIPVLITDFHGDIEIGGFKTITLSHSPTLPYGINPLELDSLDPLDGGVFAQINIVLTMLKTCIPGMGHKQYRAIKQALEAAYSHCGITDADSTTYTRPAPAFRDVLDILDRIAQDETITQADRNTAASAIAVVAKVFEHPVFNKPKQLSPRVLAQGWYRLNLKHLEEHIKFAVADTLLRKASRYLRSQGQIPVQPQSARDRFRWFLGFDEAKILSAGGANKDDINAPLNKAATEDRKFGLGLFLFSQVTKHFSDELLAQFAARLVMKPFTADEAKNNAETIGVLPAELMALEGKGDGYLKLGNGEPAVRISVQPTFKRPGYQPPVNEPEETIAPVSDPYKTFDDTLESKYPGLDVDEAIEDMEDEDDRDLPVILNSDQLVDYLKSWIATLDRFPADDELRDEIEAATGQVFSEQGLAWVKQQLQK